jgi:hypothetical protein
VQIIVDVGGVLAGLVLAELIAPRLEPVQARGRGELQPRRAASMGEQRLAGSHFGAVVPGQHVGAPIAHHHLGAIFTVHHDQVQPGFPHAYRGVWCLDARIILPELITEDDELHRSPPEVENRRGVIGVARVREGPEPDVRLVPQSDDVPVREDELRA